MRTTDAIYKLNPSVVTIRGETAYDADGNEKEDLIYGTYVLFQCHAVTVCIDYAMQ